jgi:GntR family transcriptional repressor for pyruvate dehydrogenase complex
MPVGALRGEMVERKRAELVRRLSILIREPGAFPGGRLPPERELAKELGASRTILREAMITLEAMGLVEIRERQGAFVSGPEKGDFSAGLRLLSLWPDDVPTTLMEARLMMEVPAAALAARRRSAEELARMKECLARLEAAGAEPDGGAASGAVWDSQLHSIVVDAAHNPILGRVYEALRSTMERHIETSRARLYAMEGRPEKILEEHRLLVAAIERRDPEAAAEALRAHLGEALAGLGGETIPFRGP